MSRRRLCGPTAPAGVVLASAAGDALGAGYEFGPPCPPTPSVGMVGGGGFGWAPGEWTDDTQMALAVLAPLADGHRRSSDAVEAGFRAWYDSDPADVGNQTRAVLLDSGRLGDAAAAPPRPPTRSAGNGSLMRTGPVALAHPAIRPPSPARWPASLRAHPRPPRLRRRLRAVVGRHRHAIHHAPAVDDGSTGPRRCRRALEWIARATAAPAGRASSTRPPSARPHVHPERMGRPRLPGRAGGH